MRPDCATSREFIAALFLPDDIVEVRRIWPDKEASRRPKQSWHCAADLTNEVLSSLAVENETGWGIYIGANPRRQHGGSKAGDVALFRSMFVDFDNGIDVEQAIQRIDIAGLPAPSILVASGHGVHVYWLLAEPTTDAAAWRQGQQRLIKLLGSDKGIHDPPRVMRLPGFKNTKPPVAPAVLVETHADRCYLLAALSPALKPQRPKSDSKSRRQLVNSDGPGLSRATREFIEHGASEGERNSKLFAAACDMHGNGIDRGEAEAQLIAAATRSGLSDAEAKAAIDSAYSQPRTPSRPPGLPVDPKTGEIFIGWLASNDSPAAPATTAASVPTCKLRLQHTRRPDGKVMVSVKDSVGTEVALDTINPTSATARNRLIKAVRKAVELTEEKTSELDEALRSLGNLNPADPSIEAPDDAVPLHGAYRSTDHGLVFNKPTNNGVAQVLLCNYSATIRVEIVDDDGAEQRRRFQLSAKIGKGPAISIEVPADQFTALDWPIKELGANAITFPVANVQAHIVAAIQLLSRGTTKQFVYAHTGWREVGTKHAYLHAGGAIGESGAVEGIETRLEGALASYVLASPPNREMLTTALRAVVTNLLDLGPANIMYPMVAAVFRSIIGSADFSLFLVGKTGAFKSEVASLIQRFFGAEMDARHLPGSWSSTANMLEDLAFRVKDACLVLDDFKPSGDSVADNKLHQAADRVLRAQGNRSGRGRMRADGSLRPVRPPRCLIISTGEDLPRGESLRGRMLILELRRGDIKSDALSACQNDASNGFFALVTAGFCQWLAPQLNAVEQRRRKAIASLRQTLKGNHARQSAILGDLKFGFDTFLEFIEAVTGEEVVTAIDRVEYQRRCFDALKEAGVAHDGHVLGSDPVGMYFELLSAAVSSGAAHIAAMNGAPPVGLETACGWRRDTVGPKDAWCPSGKRIGWIEAGDLYLEPKSAFFVAQGQVGDGQRIPISEPTLRRLLQDSHHLQSTDQERKRLTVRRSLEGARREVLHVLATDLGIQADPEEGGSPV